jgi:hypothetical protein
MIRAERGEGKRGGALPHVWFQHGLWHMIAGDARYAARTVLELSKMQLPFYWIPL